MIAQADPQLLFQRIIMVAGRMTENVGRYFPVCERQINRYLLINSIWTVGRGADMPTQNEKMMSFVMFLMVAHSSIDYHGKAMTVYKFATAMLIMSNASILIPSCCLMVTK